jgi:hypothetical protein
VNGRLLKKFYDGFKKNYLALTVKHKEDQKIAQIYKSIMIEEENIQDMYRQIGKMYYEHVDNIEDERFTPFFNSILESVKKIEFYKLQIKSRNS